MAGSCGLTAMEGGPPSLAKGLKEISAVALGVRCQPLSTSAFEINARAIVTSAANWTSPAHCRSPAVAADFRDAREDCIPATTGGPTAVPVRAGPRCYDGGAGTTGPLRRSRFLAGRRARKSTEPSPDKEE